jgi:hypothetical protein
MLDLYYADVVSTNNQDTEYYFMHIQEDKKFNNLQTRLKLATNF